MVDLKHIVVEGHLRPFPDLKAAFHIPNWILFRYLQLRHAFSQQFPSCNTLESDVNENLLTSRSLDKPLSSLYLCLSQAYSIKVDRVYQKWVVDIPDLVVDEWEDCLGSYVTSTV